MPEIVRKIAANRFQTGLTGRGLLAESFYLPSGAGASGLTSQQIVGAGIGLSAGDLVTNILVCVSVASSGTAPTLIKLGLYKKDGTLLASTADLSGATPFAAVGAKTFALTTPYVVPVDDIYYPTVLVNGTWSVTQPTFVRTNTSFTAGSLAAVTGGSAALVTQGSLADLPAPAVFAAHTLAYWFGVN